MILSILRFKLAVHVGCLCRVSRSSPACITIMRRIEQKKRKGNTRPLGVTMGAFVPASSLG